jgi:hypothetical protein
VVKVSRHDRKVLGPVEVETGECKPPGFANEATIEQWVLPDKSDSLELSIKVDPDEAIAGHAERGARGARDRSLVR